MSRLKTRGLMVSAALLLGTVGGSVAVSAASVTPSTHVVRHPHRNFWRYWHRTHPRNLYVVESVSATGGLFGEGELAVQNSAQKVLTINLDNLSHGYLTRGLGGRDRSPIAITSLTQGDFVVVRSEVIDVKSSALTNNNGLVLLALAVDFTGFNPATPSAIATPTPPVVPTP
ncbi:MAG TPA: hypothetical protein VMW47_08020 [Verrucomicrobiae bacterium]|nr:hypothetical protein [Verrucomicrobiae bacterium]